ncbi:MAG: JAB domain-containing protein [Bacteroidia bacterium]
MNIQLTKTQKTLIESSDDLARIMRQILLRENKLSRLREHLWTIGLNEEFKMLYVELIAFGIPAKDQVQPTEIYKLPLQKDAKYLYLCHNRKSDDMSAKDDDKALTDRMIQVGKIIGITVVDHIVINAKAEDHLSYEKIGLMDELRKSLVWVPPYEQGEMIKKMAEASGEKRKAMEMARGMKLKNIDIKIIIELSGLSAEEIERL